MTHSRRSPRAAEKARERFHAFRDRKRAEEAAPAAPPPPPRSPFDAAYSGHPITLESTEWREDDRYPRFLLDTCSAGSRLSHSRNQPNPTNI
jgi:hypothetical protein